MFSGVSLSPVAMLSSGCQALELRERAHGGARGWYVLLCWREIEKEGEDNIFSFTKV